MSAPGPTPAPGRITELWRAANREDPYLGAGSFWALRHETAEWFARWRADLGPSARAALLQAGRPLGHPALFRADVLPTERYFDMRDRFTPGQPKGFWEDVGKRLAPALAEEGHHWLILREWFYEGYRTADYAIRLTSPPHSLAIR